MRSALFVRRPVVQVALIILLLAVVAVVFTRAQDRAWATSETVTYDTLRASSAITETYNTLRVYGGPDWPKQPGVPSGNMGAGSSVVTDENTGLLVEVQPYTDTLAIFNPQLPQAPRKDSITWNPLFMSETETRDENWYKGLYQRLIASGINVSEKVWFRMWYEPEHWDKDLNFSGDLDRYLDGQPKASVNPTFTNIDEWYPAIMQEFTYMLMELKPVAEKPEPTYGLVGQTRFVFPVGMREEDRDDPYGYGLTSLDANFDGVPDIVHVESEETLQNETNIAADFDGDGSIEDLDPGGGELSGDELAVLRLDIFEVPRGGYVQFLDHLVLLEAVFDTGVTVRVWYTGDRELAYPGLRFLDVGGMVFVNFTHLLYLPLGFLSPSSSGLATVTMPIMAPLADFATVDRSLVVTAFQSASGLLNLVNPTFAVVMGGLALGRVGYHKWLRFTWPLLIILLLVYAIVLSIGVFLPGQIF